MTAFEQLTIETPEQIALEFPLAGVGSRFLSVAIDLLIQFGLLAALGALAALLVSVTGGGLWSGTGDGGRAALWSVAILLLVGFAILYGYFAFFEIAWRGQTPGKRMIGLRVIAASGRPAGATQILVRNLLRIVDQLPGPYAFGIMSVLLTQRSQRLGDLAAGTVVVHERTPQETHAVRPVAPGLRGSAPGGEAFAAAGGRLQANRLSAQELELIERFLQRRGDLPLTVREQTAATIAARVRARLVDAPSGASPGSLSGGTDEDLLERVAADYRTFGPYR